MSQASILAVEDLHGAYPAREGLRQVMRPALRGVSLEVRPGETLAVVSESGSGKSTLGKAMLRLVPPMAGRLLFEGRDITHVRNATCVPSASRSR